MNAADSTAPPRLPHDGAGDQAHLRRAQQSRTWEMELFISGATIFALLQGPGVVDRWFQHAQPHLAGGSSHVAFVAYFYAKLILYTLIATFLLHLLARAYWVALVGMHAVFPGGVRWTELGYGPALLDVFRSRLPALEQSIARVNDLCSLLFSGGAVVLLMFIMSVVILGPAIVIALTVSHLVFQGRYTGQIVLALVYTAAAVPLLVRSLDARAARRGKPSSTRMRRAAGLSYYLNVTPVIGPLSLVLWSNLGRRSANIAITVILTAIVGTFVVRDLLLQRGVLRVDSHVYLPDASALQESLPAHYADQRAAAAVYASTPFIQSDIVTEPYLRLFIPLAPQRYNPLVAERCPHLGELPGGIRIIGTGRTAAASRDAAAVIDCLSSFQPVTLNGQPLHAPQWRLATEPRSGLRGLQVLIPVHDLGAGEHVLRVEGLPQPAGRRSRSGQPSHSIRFWI